MKTLVIGTGGREHALARKLAESPQVDQVLAAPGNPGMESCATLVSVDVADHGAVVDLAKREAVDLVVVGPEAPLAAGLADALKDAGLAVFGPSKLAAEIESSKAFAKDLMKRHGIPTAAFDRCETPEEAYAAIDRFHNSGMQVVVKASGLAAGKGAIVTETADEAKASVKEIMVDRLFGAAGDEVVIEERMHGPEVSVFALTDGTHAIVLPPSQDHKPIGEGDTGPNTGGMGAYCPVPIVDDEVLMEIIDSVMMPTIRALNEEGRPYCGCLYGGFMLVNGKPKVIEFNCRFGDPETQAVLASFDQDLFPILQACAAGSLNESHVISAKRSSAMVVVASGGYPGSYEKGKVISGLDAVDEDDLWVIHAGTKRDGDAIVTAGGRVLGVVATSGQSLLAALDRCYEGVARIGFDGAMCRKDIGFRVRGPITGSTSAPGMPT